MANERRCIYRPCSGKLYRKGEECCGLCNHMADNDILNGAGRTCYPDGIQQRTDMCGNGLNFKHTDGGRSHLLVDGSVGIYFNGTEPYGKCISYACNVREL